MSYLVPMVIDSTPRGEQAMDIWSRLLKDRIIMLTTKVSEETASVIVAQLLFLESQGPEDIYFYINSPGGSVTAGLSILDTMHFIKPDVSTIVTGQAASMGSLLAAAGTKGKRLILPHAMHMIHQVRSGFEGSAPDLRVSYEETMRLNNMMIQLYVDATGQDYHQLESDMSRDRFMSAEDSVRYGLADRIINKR